MKDTSGYVYAGESRGELLSWLNGLLRLGISKIEQCGTGAVYCQIMDSLFLDVPLKKVNFSARNEYEYVSNYKILQNAFDAHGVPNHIPVDRLIKCKFQDNMEFLQWLKKYWDGHWTGMDYDAVGRRGGARGSFGSPSSAIGGVKAKSSPSAPSLAPRPSSANSAPRAPIPALPTKPSVNDATLASLKSQLSATQSALAETENALNLATRERQFYFEKLREIEILVGDETEPGPGCGMETAKLVEEIRGIMYKTEDGFEIPPEVEVEQGVERLNMEASGQEVY